MGIGIFILIFVLEAHIIIVEITEAIVKTKHKVFWWGFFFTAPIGAIIAILLDIKDNTNVSPN